MRKFQQNRGKLRPEPVWLRWVAVLCLMVVCIASTAQVCHTHLNAVPSRSDSQQNPSAPDHCPLCVAMHSALPAAIHVAPEPVLQLQTVVSNAPERGCRICWSFELLSRPPPAMDVRA